MALRDLPVAVRAPILGLGLGAIGGGFEAIKLAATLKLSVSFVDALKVSLTAVAMDAALGAMLAVPVGLALQLVGARVLASKRLALSMAATAALLGAWFLVPSVRQLLDQQRTLAAIGFALAPIGIGGVVWFNAGYWLRREELGEEHQLGWAGWSLAASVVLAVVASVMLSNRGFGGAQAIEDDPAVVLITIDTLRRDHVSAFRRHDGLDPIVETPVMDGLAADGILYADAITPFPETAPAHSAMFTGLHPYRTGMLSNGHRLSTGYATVAEILAEEGYATGAFVSSFAVDSRSGLDQGFEVYDDELFPWVRGFSEILAARLLTKVILRFGDPLKFDFLLERPAPITFDLALDWLDQVGDRPFLMWVHTFDVHSPYEPHGVPGFEENGSVDQPSIDHRWILANERDYTYTDDARAKLRSQYAEEVAWTDARLGEFITQLRTRVGDRPLLLILVSDHGEQLGEHGIEMNHHGVWDESIQVPLIIQPVVVSGKARVVTEQVRLMDLPATILTQLELDRDRMGRTESVNLLTYVDLPNQPGSATLVMGRKSASLTQGTLYGFRANLKKQLLPADADADVPPQTVRGRIKYILDPDLAQEQLYDLVDDPDELTDLATQQPDVVTQMRQRVARETGIKVDVQSTGVSFERSAVEKQHQQDISSDEQARLEALGYIQGDDEE